MEDTTIPADISEEKKGKHPKALYVLFMTEMWERFAYYLMVGILLLYLIDDKTGGKGMTEKMGADVVGSFIALVYLTPFIGGLIADRYLGYIKSIFLGGTLMALGYFGLALPGNTALYVSLLLIIVGNGFFKPNISTILGNIYNREDLKPLKDNAYNIFYMGINIGALFCNFVAAYLRNQYGWGYAFAAAGVGLVIGMIVLATSLKRVRVGEIKKEKRPEDMPIGKILGYVFLPAVIAAIIGWIVPSMVFGSTLLGSKSNDAFIFACLPIIAFYISLYINAKGPDKRGIGALLFIFFISIIFWTIYNQNSTSLTLWAQNYTDRTVSPTAEKIAGSLGFLQTVSDTPRMVNKVDEHLVDVKDYAAIASPYNEYSSKLVDGNIVDNKTKIVQEMGPDPYFNNVPKSEWPPNHSEKLANTELFQSINPLFIIILTPLLVMLFSYLRRRNKEPTTATKFGLAMFISGCSSLVMVFAIMSVASVYQDKTSPYWLWGTYFVFTISELLLSPIGLSFVSKLAPARLTALLMGGWFLSTSIGGKLAGVMTSFWNDFTDKKIFFLILVVSAFIGGILIFSRLKFLNAIVKEKTGSA
ncbi:MFS transporter [Hanamia caeni]|jgi:POT family proton-dependent oligopeptide transporter|uniref:MFS transporter n=1 Tax=Hanamia caeni TaxID=2294116 RepID=A0A3M9NMK0_9BACT|nr:peptide MFS transporter [Hanamia caeni]RNI39020.1 MFS transporter [Hanamia caeni]